MRKSTRRTAHGGRNRNWTELPDDITASILSRLGTLEILRTAQRVCMTWRRICKENSLVWKTIYIHDENYIDMTYLDKICRHVIDLSSGNLVDVSIEYIGTDQLLKYMAESSSGIRRLRFVNCTRLTDEGFSEVALKLPLLEDLDISKCDNISSKSLQVLLYGGLQSWINRWGTELSHCKTKVLYSCAHHLIMEIDDNDFGFTYGLI